MFKFVAIVLMALIAFVAAKPAVLAPLAYSAPLVAAPASAVVSQEYHGNGFVSPYVSAYSAPFVAAPAAYSAPLLL
ncbi:uncharacterized protein LOC119649031 [Hermetia illucens]|uniref:uncharacterized protein LOC119649031 n=1 Tax=Hermetia illucens TaxID=343691 RepID=UPI0018CC4111|nr:uncharacterized protein LOC119649031 [Hermetia illucens]